mmetsp:Transcript_92361/g.270364  ORF Transcript_92361/g.270364 Transcript_92361/m.270364 type:complete len:230 (+) Transcript_92361:244-933(+)
MPLPSPVALLLLWRQQASVRSVGKELEHDRRWLHEKDVESHTGTVHGNEQVDRGHGAQRLAPGHPRKVEARPHIQAFAHEARLERAHVAQGPLLVSLTAKDRSAADATPLLDSNAARAQRLAAEGIHGQLGQRKRGAWLSIARVPCLRLVRPVIGWCRQPVGQPHLHHVVWKHKLPHADRAWEAGSTDQRHRPTPGFGKELGQNAGSMDRVRRHGVVHVEDHHLRGPRK